MATNRIEDELDVANGFQTIKPLIAGKTLEERDNNTSKDIKLLQNSIRDLKCNMHKSDLSDFDFKKVDTTNKKNLMTISLNEEAKAAYNSTNIRALTSK